MLALPPGLDPDLLRSFVLIAEGGSFTRAAQAVGRTQSAVSMQIRRLEEPLGQPLLRRAARGGLKASPASGGAVGPAAAAARRPGGGADAARPMAAGARPPAAGAA